MKSAHFDSSQCKRGFTLVELLVVISIIAILSVVGITVFSGVQKNARDAKRRGDIDAIAKALEQYKAQNGSYPVDNGCSNWNSLVWGNGLATGLTALVPGYIASLPDDPRDVHNDVNCSNNCAGEFGECYSSNGTTFTLGAHLENGPAVSGVPYEGNFAIHNQQ